jgi:hypothetical protein
MRCASRSTNSEGADGPLETGRDPCIVAKLYVH